MGAGGVGGREQTTLPVTTLTISLISWECVSPLVGQDPPALED